MAHFAFGSLPSQSLAALGTEGQSSICQWVFQAVAAARASSELGCGGSPKGAGRQHSQPGFAPLASSFTYCFLLLAPSPVLL